MTVNAGGLGTRSTVHLVPSALLFSAAASKELVHQILSSCFQSKEVPHVDAALTVLSSGHDFP